ncbi:MAG: carbohydrate kinase family protein [Lentisphaeria bacterium]|jgi:sugar/nucleoside kinase (ribokinase family)|nr:carbohydrate kinase family protein [Lentisphaeria bacterium]MDP7742800.1 carbohydrate kinase family protein [Lentisphaeria bacterium]
MRFVVVAGHVCIDIIPEIERGFELVPGRLVEIGPAVSATGGAVSNTGVALHILDIPAVLMGKVGDDSFGSNIVDIFNGYDESLGAGMNVVPGEATSYTVVVSIPGQDRTFMHCPGANDTFTDDDLAYDQIDGAAIFHFGYPPLMQKMYENDGASLIRMMQRVKERGVATSLDMTVPDPDGPSGQVDWARVLAGLKGHLDIFMPSADEILYMLDRAHFGRGDDLSGDEVTVLGRKLLDLDVAVAGVKLGGRGLYICTAGAERLAKISDACTGDLENWADRELWFPVYEVENFATAAGAGDTTIAGFIASMLRGFSIEDAGATANMVGALNVQAADALSGLKDWDTTLALRQTTGRVPLEVTGSGWTEDAATGVWTGPNDS